MPSDKIIVQCLEWLYNQPSPVIFTLKEFEKRYKRVKSMTSVQFKELLDYLIMEGKLEVAKCGSINVYYLYISVSIERHREEYARLQSGNIEGKEALAKDRNEYESISKTHGPGEERYENLQRYRQLVREGDKWSKQLYKAQNDSNHWDDRKVQFKLNEIEKYKKNLSLHADNIENLIAYISKEYTVPDTQIREEFDIPDEFKTYI